MAQEKSLKANILYNTIKIFLSLLFPLISFPYASRILLPDNIGKVNFAGSIISYFSMVAMLGIYGYGVRECAKARDDKAKLSTIVAELLTINIVSLLIAYALLTISIFLVPKFFEYRMLLIVYSATMLFGFIGIEWLYNGLEEYRYITIRSFIFQLISIIALFSFVKTKEDYIKYALISVCASGGSSIFNFIHARKFIDFSLTTKKMPLQHLRGIFTMFGIAVTASIFTMLDTTMVGMLSTSFQVGIYSAALKGVKLIRDIIAVISATLMPRVSYYVEKNDTERVNALLEKNLHITLFFAIPATILLAINSKLIIQVLSGNAFFDSIPCVNIMVFTIFFSSISLIVDQQLFIPMNHEELNLIGLVIGAITDFVLNILLIPTMGAIGACIGTVAAEGLMFIYHLVFLCRYYTFKKTAQTVTIYVIGGIVMFAICSISYFLQTSMFLKLGISIVASIMYLLILCLKKNFIITYVIKLLRGLKK